MELTIFAQNNETQQVEFTVHRDLSALSNQNRHNVDGTSSRALVTASAVVTALSKAEEHSCCDFCVQILCTGCERCICCYYTWIRGRGSEGNECSS